MGSVCRVLCLSRVVQTPPSPQSSHQRPYSVGGSEGIAGRNYIQYCARQHWAVPNSTGLCPTALGCAQQHWAVPGSTGLCLTALGCARQHWAVPDSTGAALGCARQHWAVPGSTGAALGCARQHWAVPNSTGLCLLRYLRFCSTGTRTACTNPTC